MTTLHPVDEHVSLLAQHAKSPRAAHAAALARQQLGGGDANLLVRVGGLAAPFSLHDAKHLVIGSDPAQAGLVMGGLEGRHAELENGTLRALALAGGASGACPVRVNGRCLELGISVPLRAGDVIELGSKHRMEILEGSSLGHESHTHIAATSGAVSQGVMHSGSGAQRHISAKDETAFAHAEPRKVMAHGNGVPYGGQQFNDAELDKFSPPVVHQQHHQQHQQQQPLQHEVRQVIPAGQTRELGSGIAVTAHEAPVAVREVPRAAAPVVHKEDHSHVLHGTGEVAQVPLAVTEPAGAGPTYTYSRSPPTPMQPVSALKSSSPPHPTSSSAHSVQHVSFDPMVEEFASTQIGTNTPHPQAVVHTFNPDTSGAGLGRYADAEPSSNIGTYNSIGKHAPLTTSSSATATTFGDHNSSLNDFDKSAALPSYSSALASESPSQRAGSTSTSRSNSTAPFGGMVASSATSDTNRGVSSSSFTSSSRSAPSSSSTSSALSSLTASATTGAGGAGCAYSDVELARILDDMLDISGTSLAPSARANIPLWLGLLPTDLRKMLGSAHLKTLVQAASEERRVRMQEDGGDSAPLAGGMGTGITGSTNNAMLEESDLGFALLSLVCSHAPHVASSAPGAFGASGFTAPAFGGPSLLNLMQDMSELGGWQLESGWKNHVNRMIDGQHLAPQARANLDSTQLKTWLRAAAQRAQEQQQRSTTTTTASSGVLLDRVSLLSSLLTLQQQQQQQGAVSQ